LVAINPHYNHLWATTCPNDPSWQPGEGRDEGWEVDYSTRPVLRDADHNDPRVPLFPCKRVRPLCAQAVSGQLVVQDSLRSIGASATVAVMLDSLVTGYRLRDAYARRAVLETKQHPVFELKVDSLTGVRGTDTIQASVEGTLRLRGVTRPVRFPVVGWREAGGLRVQGQLSFPAHELVDTYGMSSWALGLGVALRRWRTVHVGADLLLRRGAP